nr:MAG TPA: Protein of unknown function (DUF4223) [Bacteriophage sp.]DAV69323.1 MAG TPA: Protein of unknown function (DUF4223) [Caudoviricetes sp.]
MVGVCDNLVTNGENRCDYRYFLHDLRLTVI